METKKCTKCLIDQNIENFYLRRARNQRRTICKECESKQKAKPVEHIPDLKGEIWKDIEGFEGIYLVSNKARVKRIMHRKNPTNTIMNTNLNGGGYPHLSLTVNGKGHDRILSRLVAIAFIPNPENKPEVNHINGIKTDNTVENLEWNTTLENINHAWETGLAKPQNGTSNGNAILTEKEVLEIRASNLHKHRLSTIYKVSVSTIDHILKRTRWKHI